MWESTVHARGCCSHGILPWEPLRECGCENNAYSGISLRPNSVPYDGPHREERAPASKGSSTTLFDSDAR